uniref:Uncharacterized protein n=1 Tax=Vitis vinifera TaxID=29760 RepID=A5BE63_VITVI|nr:hypothetical protein VITISV_019816 [Vitis vinifera]
MSIANIGKLQENTAALCKMAVKFSGIPNVGYPEKMERHPARIPDVGYPEKVECHPARIPDVGYPKKMERRKGDRLRVHGVGTHPEQLHPDSSSEHAALANITHPDDSISYPDTALAIITPGR